MCIRRLIWALTWIGSLYAQSNPVPLVNNPLSPDCAAPGAAGFTLTVNGTGFVSGSVVDWNGSPRATVFVNRSQLTAPILAADVAAAGTASVTVVSPAPGGGASNVVFFPVRTASTLVPLATASTYTLNRGTGLAVGDLNGDGKLDLVVGNDNSPASVTVQLGNGDGTFQLPVAYATDDASSIIAMADLNNDGKPDLVVATGSYTIDILLGNGDGTFQPFTSLDVAANFGIAVGDFNGDGNLDIAAAYGPTVGILLGNGDGTFQPPAGYAAVRAYAMVTADFNRDGHLDLAIVAPNYGVVILLGNGDGTFQPPALIHGKYYYSSLVTADFNKDGIPDLAVGGEDGRATVLLGRGNGTFREGGSYSIGQYFQTLVVGDFNGDGNLDLAASAGLSYGGNWLAILPGNGDGTFRSPLTTAGGVLMNYAVAGDFNGDGQLDLAGTQGGALSINLQTNVSLSPGLLDFAPTIEKKSPTKTVTLTNLAASSLSVSQVALSGLNASEFALTSDTCQGATIPASGTCTVDVAFTPSATGSQSALLTITDGATVPQQTTALIGNGTQIELSPARLNFGDVNVGSFSAQQLVEVANVGSSTVDIKAILVVGADAKDFVQTNSCGSSLRAKATCSILVQFTPQKKGARSAGLSLNVKQGPEFDPKNTALFGTGM